MRDVPAEDVGILRARAAARKMSLSSYLRDLIHHETSRPAMDEVIARIATRESIEVDSDVVRSFREDGRRA